VRRPDGGEAKERGDEVKLKMKFIYLEIMTHMSATKSDLAGLRMRILFFSNPLADIHRV
jgi:hypothetical protein